MIFIASHLQWLLSISFPLSSFISYVLSFFYSFHLDAPTTSPTPTTNPVNQQGTVCPHLLSLSIVCLCEHVCVWESACTNNQVILETRNKDIWATQSQKGLWTASSNQIVLPIGDMVTGSAGLSETPAIVLSSLVFDLRKCRRSAFLPYYLISICSYISAGLSIIL